MASSIRVLGSADWHQTAYNDHSCYSVNGGEILIDACPSVVTHMLENGEDPAQTKYLLFTHMHCDHYMGLPPLLHYLRVVMNKDLSGLTIIGPKQTVRRIVERTLLYIFDTPENLESCIEKRPNIIELQGDQSISLGNYILRAVNSDHAVPGLCYRLTDRQTGHALGISGDTRYQAIFADLFQKCELLLYESSRGPVETDESINALCRHSSAADAVRVCNEARVQHLLLTHAYEPTRQASLQAAKAGLNIQVEWAAPYKSYFF